MQIASHSCLFGGRKGAGMSNLGNFGCVSVCVCKSLEKTGVVQGEENRMEPAAPALRTSSPNMACPILEQKCESSKKSKFKPGLLGF